jgi:hypothetical protein
MTIIFQPGWQNPKLESIPDESTLTTLRTGKSNTQQKKEGISVKDIKYKTENNAKRKEGAVFLSIFNETDVRNAIQYAHAAFNNAPDVKGLLTMALGSTHTVTIDQGTHQDEDRNSGGFMLHFDARPPSGMPCFHLYVGQNTWGGLRIIKASFRPKEYLIPDYV